MIETQHRKLILVTLYLLFLGGILAGFLVWNVVKLPFANPFGMTSPATQMRFNPASDVLRFLIFISIPSLFLALFFFLSGKNVRNAHFGRKLPAPVPAARLTPRLGVRTRIGILGCALLTALGHPTYHAWGDFDFFHEGETLTAAVDYLEGKSPYEETFFVHGTVQDPLRSVAAFQLFGRSIGSVRTLESAVKVLVFLLFSVLLMRLFRLPVVVYLIFLGLGASDLLFKLVFTERIPPYIMLPRDITLFVFLIMLVSLVHLSEGGRTRAGPLILSSGVFSFISFGALGYSIDRGLFLVVCYLVLSLLLYLFKLDRRGRRFYVLGSLTGIFAALLTVGSMVRWAFKPFLHFLFTFPKESDLNYSLPFPFTQLRYALVLIVFAVLMFVLTRRFLKNQAEAGGRLLSGIKSFFQDHFVEISLFLVSLVFFKSALGRSDAEHLAYSLPPLLILSIFMLSQSRFFLSDWLRKNQTRLSAALLILVSGIFLFEAIGGEPFSNNFPLYKPDEQFVPSRYQEPIQFIKNNLSRAETVYVLTDEIAWYYLLGKVPPTSVHNVQMASMRGFQEKIVHDLMSSPIKFVIYQKHSWDNIDLEVKYPVLMEFIHKNFQPFKIINGVNLWTRINSVQWGLPMMIPSPQESSSWFPDLAVDSRGRVHFIWCESLYPWFEDGQKRSGMRESVLYSMWDRQTWSSPEEIAGPGSGIFRNALAVDSSDMLHVLYSDGDGNKHVLKHISLDANGSEVASNWSIPIRLSGKGQVYMSDLTAEGQVLHAVFDCTNGGSGQAGSSDVFYTQVSLQELSQTEPFSLLPNSTGSARVQLDIDQGGVIHVTWDEGWDRFSGIGRPRYGIYYRSSDGGKTWSDPLRIDDSHSAVAQLCCGADGRGGIILVWRTVDTEENSLYFLRSVNDGRTWSPPEKIPSVHARRWSSTPFDIYDMVADQSGHLHLLAVGHLTAEEISIQPPSLLHLEWNGQRWLQPKLIYAGSSFPESPRVVFQADNELHVTWFTREKLWTQHDEVQHKVWFSSGKIFSANEVR